MTGLQETTRMESWKYGISSRILDGRNLHGPFEPRTQSVTRDGDLLVGQAMIKAKVIGRVPRLWLLTGKNIQSYICGTFDALTCRSGRCGPRNRHPQTFCGIRLTFSGVLVEMEISTRLILNIRLKLLIDGHYLPLQSLQQESSSLSVKSERAGGTPMLNYLFQERHILKRDAICQSQVLLNLIVAVQMILLTTAFFHLLIS